MRKSAASLIFLALAAAPGVAAQSIPADPVFGDQFESGLVGFAPNLGFLPQGAANAATLPAPLTLTLSDAPLVNTFVPVVSSSPLDLVVVDGGVTVPAGQTSAVVLFNAINADANPVIVSAQVGNARAAAVRIEAALNESDTPAEADFCNLQFPANFSVVVGTQTPQVFGQLFEAGATEVAGAPPGWIAELGFGPSGSDPRELANWRFVPASYNLQVGNNDEFVASLVAPVAQGTYLTAVRFSADQGGHWTYCDVDGAGSNAGLSFEIVALGSMTVVPPPPSFAINEVDYDQPGTDTGEFIELYNGTPSTASLANLAIVLVNGASSSEYGRVLLSGNLAAGSYAVICPQGAVPGTCTASIPLPPAVQVFNFAVATDAVQNGAPDAIGLLNLATFAVVDKLSYEGSVVAPIAGFGTIDFVENSPTTAVDGAVTSGSVQRRPNGVDTNNASVDWIFGPTSPGAPNL